MKYAAIALIAAGYLIFISPQSTWEY